MQVNRSYPSIARSAEKKMVSVKCIRVLNTAFLLQVLLGTLIKGKPNELHPLLCFVKCFEHVLWLLIWLTKPHTFRSTTYVCVYTAMIVSIVCH